jgi:hypothetical protein
VVAVDTLESVREVRALISGMRVETVSAKEARGRITLPRKTPRLSDAGRSKIEV